MSRLMFLIETRGGIARGAPPAPPPTTNIVDKIDALSPISHWRLNEVTGTEFADRLTVANMTATGAPQRLPRTIINNDVTADCIALDGSTTFLHAINPASKLYDVTQGAIGVFFQPDTSVLKQNIISRPGTSIAGAMSLEYLSSGRVRGWRYDGTGVLREVLGSIGGFPAGDSRLLLMSWGPAGLKLYRGEVELGTVAITDWAVNPSFNANVGLGAWTLSLVDCADGVFGHAFFLSVQPTNGQVADLAQHAASISWAEDIDAGTVDKNVTTPVVLKTGGSHYKSPLVPTIDSQGTLGTSTVSGENINYLSGNVNGFDDLVAFHFTSANGSVSQVKQITIDVVGAAEFPETVPNLQGWVSTTHSAFGSPAHNTPIQNLPNVTDAVTLFSQGTLGLRMLWDSVTFNVPVLRSDGTRYYTRTTALARPGLVIICGVADTGVGDVAFAGAASTQTPGSDPQEDAWNIRRTTGNTIRGLTAATGGITFADCPAILNEKLLIVLRVSGSELEIWRNGFKAVSQAISGGQIAADGAQVLGARYYNNLITGIIAGGFSEYAQYSVAPSRSIQRQLISYWQGLWWPGVAAPPTATVNAGDILQGSTLDLDIIAALAAAGITTTGYILASIDVQPSASGVTVSVVANKARIVVAPGATLGNTSFVYCVQRTTA